MMLDTLNAMTEEQAETSLLAVCGSRRWVSAMLKARPFESVSALHERAEDAWARLAREDWLDAFAAHPRIGDTPRREATWSRAAPSQSWSRTEQRGMAGASDATRARVADLNRHYEQRFGYIFIICATGRTADEMVQALETRLSHTPEEELPIAVSEQAKIIRVRLDKLLQANAATVERPPQRKVKKACRP